MTSDLMTRAGSVEVFRKKTGDITFPRFSVLAGVRLVSELSAKNDVTHISLSDFCRPFHGVACGSTRKRAKSQLRYVIKTFIEDGQLAIPEYGDDGQLVGLVFVRCITSDSQDDILPMIASWAAKARRQKELGTTHLTRLDATVSQLLPSSCALARDDEA